MKTLLICLTSILIVLSACGRDDGQPEEKPEERENNAEISQILPRSRQLTGLEPVGDPLVLPPDRAEDILGDLTEIYLHYDLEKMALANCMDDIYHNQYMIEVLKYPSRDHAYGLFLHLMGQEDTLLQVGAEGIRHGGILRFFKGKYVVEIVGTGPDFEIEKNVMALALAAQANIDTDIDLPSAAEVFPEPGMVERSMRFHPHHFTPAPAFAPSYSAKYYINSELLQVVYMSSGGRNALEKFITAHVKGDPQPAASNYGSHAYTFDVPVIGNVFVFIKGDELIAIISKRDIDIPAEFTNSLLEIFNS